PGRLCGPHVCASICRNAGLAATDTELAERPIEARLDPSPPQATKRDGRRLHPGRLPAAAGDRTTSRSHHRFCTPASPRRRYRRGGEIVRGVHGRRPLLATRGVV